MRRAIRHAVCALVGLAVGCGESHVADECTSDADCAPLACDSVTTRRTCVARCSREADGTLCEDGAYCTGGRCSAGGDVGEGGIVHPAPLAPNECAFGLAPAYDYTTEPIVYRCYRACETAEDCHPDEVCSGTECRQRCEGALGTPCESPARCSMGLPDTPGFGFLCVSPRRIERADCDGDGNLVSYTGDCFPEFACDASAPGGCARVPDGEL